MRRIFIDTSYFIALVNVKDLYHNSMLLHRDRDPRP